MESIINIIIDAAARIAAEDREIAARAQAEGLDFSEPVEITASALASRIVAEARAELANRTFTLDEAEKILSLLASITARAEFAPATFAADPVDACLGALGLNIDYAG
jgi:hypothetical protein